MGDNTQRGRTIAKNTALLYCRMLFLLFVGLYTSRVVLASLGIEDFGVFQAVGGVVAMLSVVTGALSSAISRFLTFELGKGGKDLRNIFAASVRIQLIISLLVVIICEPVGLWFLENHMTIPEGRMTAAVWVMQFALASFVVTLLSVPYNAAIVAHERMGAFAAVGIFEGLAKLAVAFAISVASTDRLIMYAGLLFAVALAVRMLYGVFCVRNFEECRGRASNSPTIPLMKQMFSFAGWNFIGASSAVLRDQGANILLNVFSGAAVNAARGVALQLGGAVQSFATNFMTAINPQITKSYASGERDYMMKLIYKGARFSYFLLLLFAVPVCFNAEFLMGVWLKEVPSYAALFVRLGLIYVMVESVSSPLVTAMLATGDIKKYQIIVGGIQMLNVPVSWALLHFGAAPYVVYLVAIGLAVGCLASRLVLLRTMIGLKAGEFLLKVVLRVIGVSALACVIPAIYLLSGLPVTGWAGLGFCALSLLSSALSIFAAGLDKDERKLILNKISGK